MPLQVWAFFTDKTIIAIPLQHTLNQVDDFGILSKRNNILGQVKKYINNNLDSNSKSFSNDLSIQEILSNVGITEDDYYWALSISPDNDYEIHLKRSTGSCFVNNYNPVLLKAWEANLDIQPVHNYFKALTYMTVFFSKSESKVSESLINFFIHAMKKQHIHLQVHANFQLKELFIMLCQSCGLENVLQESLSLIQICLTIELG